LTTKNTKISKNTKYYWSLVTFVIVVIFVVDPC